MEDNECIRASIAPIVEPERSTNPSQIDLRYFANLSEKIPDKYIFGEDVANLQYLIDAWHLITNIASHSFELPFEMHRVHKRPKLIIKPLGHSLINFITTTIEGLDTAYKNHKLSPALEATIEICKGFKPETHPEELKFVFDDDIEKVVSEYNLLALRMREVVRSKGIGEKVKSFRRNATRNYNQLMRVMQACHERCHRILLIRLDWSENRKDPLSPIEKISESEFDELAVRQGEARKKMVKYLKFKFKSNLLFYAWKIEWGVQKGFHIHWLIGLNGTKYNDRINVPYHIAKGWDQMIFSGNSHTHNINAMPGNERAGLRVLHYSDSQAGSAFGLFADYLTKVDYNLKLRLPMGMRSFGCSKLPFHQTAKKGPKRRYPAIVYDYGDVRGKRGRPMGRRYSVKLFDKGLK